MGGNIKEQIQEILDKLIINDAATDSLAPQKEAEALVATLKNDLDLDDLNFNYFFSLYRSFKRPNENKRPLRIYEKDEKGEGKGHSQNTIVYPTAIAAKELLDKLPVAQYSKLKDEIDVSIAEKALLWIKKMQAGTGTSMVRNGYLASFYNKPVDEIKIGAKGTDLFKKVNQDYVSLAEIQILQSIADVHAGLYGGIVLHDIVSNETEKSINSMWKKPCFIERNKTYDEMVKSNPKLDHFGSTKQFHIPTLDEDDRISFERMAPGGHGLFGVEAIYAAYNKKLRPKQGGLILIGSVGNGEDLGSSPDPVMVSWMIKEKIPIAMITTTKTDIDLKGGQISITKGENNNIYISMMEKAQAEVQKQAELFKSLGLREGDKDAYFNTNVILVNYNILIEKIEKLVCEIGEQEFLNIITPDLILNKKAQTDSGGKEKIFTQLEGAMGSVVLNLDHFWRTKYNEGLIHILNVDRFHRAQFFSPVKTGFDFFMQFYSDRFELDLKSWRLTNKRPGYLPYVFLKDKFYKDVENTLTAFSGCSIVDLETLEIEGIVIMPKQSLAGRVKIISHSNRQIYLANALKKATISNNIKLVEDGIYHLKDVSLEVDANGQVVKIEEL